MLRMLRSRSKPWPWRNECCAGDSPCGHSGHEDPTKDVWKGINTNTTAKKSPGAQPGEPNLARKVPKSNQSAPKISESGLRSNVFILGCQKSSSRPAHTAGPPNVPGFKWPDGGPPCQNRRFAMQAAQTRSSDWFRYPLKQELGTDRPLQSKPAAPASQATQTSSEP